jgi:ubiquinone/menaquinone biosynthesis C-methylase UbiE
VPLGGVLSGDWNAYRYLAGSSTRFYSFIDLKELLKPFGFDLVIRKKFLFGSVNLLVATKM